MSSDKVMVIVEIVGDPVQKLKKLNLECNLSDIREELEEKDIDMNLLLFAKKLDNKFADVGRKDEKDMLLSDIIIDNSGNIFLYLRGSSPIWEYFNKKCKLVYGRNMNSNENEIKVASNEAFKMKNCEFDLIGSEGYKKGQFEYGPKVELNKNSNLLLGTDINVRNFIEFGLSFGKTKNESIKDEVNSIYRFTEFSKATLIFSKKNLELTDDFKKDIENVIESKNQYKLYEIIDKYGKFVPTEVILGGKVYFRNVKSSTQSSENKSKEGSANLNIGIVNAKIGGNFSDSKGKTDFYSIEYIDKIGGSNPVGENFDEEAWNKSLEDYQTWGCIEYKKFTNIFQLLPDEIYKKLLKSIGKIILRRMIVKNYDYCVENLRKYQIIELTYEDSKIILNEDADCDIFATVVNDDENSKKKVFFNCQILKNSIAKPSIVIHGFQKEFPKRTCKLTILIMVIGYDVDFSSIRSNDSVDHVELVTNVYNSKKLSMTLPSENTPFFGIPVLNSINYLNSSITIGHNFRKLNNELIVEPFSYCLENNCYRFTDLPKFTFYTVVIKNDSNTRWPQKLKYRNDGKIKLNDKSPKYISMYFSEANSYLPVFMIQNNGKVYLKHICNKCDRCKQGEEYEIMYYLI
ncbi:hypothetical protein RclHR1_09420006 [Rhizophagus clarus]|uniref:Uncharacterized protein n=1 Tax=Rhizophagus clarus TaxID=94130 RepID=A0A2Z6S486_9GLOM|nr:hypothetical protein RclHR1_09420006 [Rhizophagus clarus]GES80264.1 hypothetical protein GLOIN_2v1497522 [Rhizophagus clarus]